MTLTFFYLITQVLLFLLSCPWLQLIIRIPSVRLSKRFDIEFAIDIFLSINCKI